MYESSTPGYFSDRYHQRLVEFADQSDGVNVVDQLNDRYFAPSSTQSDEIIPYVRVGEPSAQRPVLYVPGFTEGIEAKAPFAIEMARQGAEMILPDQNRKRILKHAVTGGADATHSQAQNYLDVLRAEGLHKQSGSVDIVAHSYGSLIFDEMHRIATDENLPCFKDARVVLLAPAGTNTKENFATLTGRFLHGVVTENFTGKVKDFPDENGDALKAGMAIVRANVPRAIRETFELAARRVDYARLMRSEIGQLAVLSYAEDDVFPARLAQAAIETMFADRGADAVDVSWATPISLQPDRKNPDAIRGGRDASHNDEHFNPARVVGAVMQVLRPRLY